jgi:transcriptional regulator with XRE-family HTH domain
MIKNNIGYWVKKRGVKIKFISKQLNVSYQTVSNWMNNRSQPNLTQAAMLSELLNVTLDDLIQKGDSR